jgi:predicted dehydrogenase
MKILIAGFGSIGRRHFRNLLALGEDDILFYRTARSTLPDEELRGFRVETDLQAALAQRPQAVIIANPTALHLNVAIPAAQAGCHIFMEKPVSHSLEGIDQLLEAVQRSGVQVLVGYQYRFHPGLQRVRQLLVEDAIGRPLSVHSHWGEYLPDWHPWEDYRQGYSARSGLGGGVILTLSHPLDYLRWLIGDVSALWAFAGHLSGLELDVEDTAEIGLRFFSGPAGIAPASAAAHTVLGSLHLDYFQRPQSHHVEIIGERGTIQWNNSGNSGEPNSAGMVRLYRAAAQAESFGAATGGVSSDDPGGWQDFPAPQSFERNDLFVAQMRHFLQVARGEVSPVCTLEDGLKALQLALAALESQQQGRLICF